MQAFNASGSGDYSEEISEWTAECAPHAPVGLQTTAIHKTSLSLAWMDEGDNEDGFHIERSGGGGAAWSTVGSVDENAAAFDDTGLTCGTPYSYRIQAYNTGGEAASDILETITTPCDPSLSAVYGPQGVVNLTWTDPGQGTTEYALQRALHNGVPDWVVNLPPDQYDYRDLNVDCGPAYDYYVVAINPSGESDWPAPQVVDAVCSPTTAMTLEASNPTYKSIRLTWSASSGGQTGYKLLRSIDGLDNWLLVAELRDGETQYVDASLASDSTYYYRLWASNAGGQIGSNITSGSTEFAIMLPIVIR